MYNASMPPSIQIKNRIFSTPWFRIQICIPPDPDPNLRQIRIRNNAKMHRENFA